MAKKIIFIILAVLFLISVCACSPAATPQQCSVKPSPVGSDGMLRTYYIDVGQGDSELICLPNGQTVLIDAGDAKSADKVISFIQSLGVSRLDYVIATHPHADHIGGMADVIEAFDVGGVYMPKVSQNTKTFEKLLLTIKNKGLKINTAKENVVLLDSDGIKAVFVAPCRDKYNDLNNYSAVLKLTFGEVSFLFMGDAEKESEREITADISADIIKLGHHGSSTSSSKAFLQAASPAAAIISCEENNSYGHPHAGTLKTLEALGIAAYRTDESGTVTVITDGKTYKIETEK